MKGSYDKFLRAAYSGPQGITKEASGNPPIIIPWAAKRPLKQLTIAGNSLRTITIGGVEYVIPAAYALLDNSGSTATAYACKRISDSATGYLNLTTGVFTASSFTAGNELPLPNGGAASANLYDGTTNYFPITSDMVGQTISWRLFDSTNFVRSAIAATESGVETYIGTTASDTHTITTYDATNGHLWIEKSGKVAFTAAELVSQQLMVVLGSTVPTTYEAYGTKSQPLGVKGVGERTENLFDKNAARTLTVADMIANKNKVLFTDCNIPNLVVGATVAVNSDVKSINIPCTKGDNITIYYAGGVPSGANQRFYWCEVDGDMVITKATAVYTSINNACTFTVTEDDTEVLIVEMETITDLCKDVVVVVKGSTAPTSYIPYGYKIPILVNSAITNVYHTHQLLAAGTYKDTLDAIAGSGAKRVGTKILDGTEDWFEHTRNGGYVSFKISNAAHFKGRIGLSTHYSYYNFVGTSLDRVCFSFGADLSTFYIVMENSYNVTSLKAYLAAQYAAGTPVTVWYPPATEVAETITPISITPSTGQNIIDAQADVKPTLTIKYIK